jgi:hypothetical protein
MRKSRFSEATFDGDFLIGGKREYNFILLIN